MAASLSNIFLSKTYVGVGGSTIRFMFNVNSSTSLTTKYQIYLDSVLLNENSLTATPYSVSQDIVLSAGGTIKIVLTDSAAGVVNWTYPMYYEDRDLFTIIRRMEYDTSTIVNNAVITTGVGINLAPGSSTAEVLTELPTLGKAKLSTITIDGSTDGTVAKSIVVATLTPVDLTDYLEYSFAVDKTKYDLINSFTIDDVANTLTINANVHSTKTVQISKDGITFVGYNGTSWSSDFKMTEAQVEALTVNEYVKFHTSAFEERLFIKVYLDSNNTIDGILISKITGVFAANEAAIIDTLALSLSQIHSEGTTLTAYLHDNEGDTIDYKVMIKADSDTDYIQNTPATGWITVSNKTNISHSYTNSNFKLGNNAIKIQTRDQRGALRDSNVVNLQFVNSAPIQTSYVCGDFSLQAVINDSNNDALAYRIFINGIQKYPATGYTDYQACPRVIYFSWNSSDLKYGLNNEIKLEVVDQYQGKLVITSTVLGTYKGLLFKDENGNYYTTDTGNLLKYIELGKYIAGSITTPKLVVLENHTGDAIGNVTLKVSEDTVYDGIDMNISPSLTPFNKAKQIVIPYTLNNKDQYNFYIRIDLDRHVQKTGETLLKITVE